METEKNLYRFDTHIHTRYSPCSNIDLRELPRVAFENGLNEIVVKDHNQIQGALEAREAARGYFEGELIKVRLGIELTTQFGEIGVSFLSDKEAEEIMEAREANGKFDFLKVARLLDEIRERKGSKATVDFHHPYDGSRRGSFDIKGAIDSGYFEEGADFRNFWDTVEMNTSCMRPNEVKRAVELAVAYNRPSVCVSDGHFMSQVGRYWTETPYPDAHSAIKNAKNADAENRADLLVPSVSPDEINYLRSRYYRTLSGLRKMLKRAA